ncbi:MAG: Flp family type IVb pilin [Parvularculaceae bacterium]
MTTATRSFGLKRMLGAVSRFFHDARGATAIEYSLIVALIFLAIVGAVRALSTTTSSMYSDITSTLQE